MKVSLSVSTIIYLFLALEILFYSSFAVSDTFGFTLASRRWEERYWRPINSFGYRDVEHNLTELGNKKVLFVVGDSFVAGHGISQTENRFFEYPAAEFGWAVCGCEYCQEWLEHHR
jgi:hypothetical protein